jgi:hypothetical protein
MPQSCIDPYAELDNRADAAELSEEFRKPVRILLAPRRGLPRTLSGKSTASRIRI